MGKTVDFADRHGNEYTLAFEKMSYVYGGLAIEVHCKEKGDEWWEPYGTLTKNLGWTPDGNEAYLDDNNLHDLVERVMAEGWAAPIGADRSGFCTYPLVKFTDEFLDEVCYVEGDEL